LKPVRSRFIGRVAFHGNATNAVIYQNLFKITAHAVKKQTLEFPGTGNHAAGRSKGWGIKASKNHGPGYAWTAPENHGSRAACKKAARCVFAVRGPRDQEHNKSA
jgi:hypothetical protein